MPPPIDVSELEAVAKEAAARAGALLLQKWNEPRLIASKGFRDLVTDADTDAQKLITDLISERFVGHGFLTEEENRLPRDGPVVWIIDPVDGTNNYSRHLPTYCTSIAALADVETVSLPSFQNEVRSGYALAAGAIYDPTRDEMFSAAAGLGSTLNGRPLRVSQTQDLEEAIVGLEWSRRHNKRQALLEAISGFVHHVRAIRATGSAALALAWVAAGRLDLYCNLGLSPWDVAAASLMIREAGGEVRNLQGRLWMLDDSGCIASNGRLYHSFVALSQLGDSDIR